jgi:nitrite reductase/ring-hydroxylating ferredoxin subunit
MVRLTHPPFDVLVANVAGELHAIEDACPHSGQSLCAGTLDGFVVTCLGHGWELDVRNGEVLTAIGRGLSNPRYDVRVEGDDVIVSARPHSASSSTRS